MFQLLRYRREDVREPFCEWLNGLRDLKAQARIRVRLNHLALGNFGDCKPVGEGVPELRIHVGPGHRVYCARRGTVVVLLLTGGDKSSQQADIKRAKELWAEWKRRQR
ncbi:MAG TPA: type II toxin-antitoxin system RelE/ParE family toxin [Xanthobacteraceae bacterium]|jgi:putative addiction module killer protein